MQGSEKGLESGMCETLKPRQQVHKRQRRDESSREDQASVAVHLTWSVLETPLLGP